MINEVETCDQCGFDAAEYTRPDLLGTLRARGVGHDHNMMWK